MERTSPSHSRSVGRIFSCAALVFWAFGCSSSDAADGAAQAASGGAGGAGGSALLDARLDDARDTATTEVNAGGASIDAFVEAFVDASVDAAVGASVDASVDAALDALVDDAAAPPAHVDASRSDGSADARPSATGYSGNPIISSIYTADPTARVFNGRLYLYPSHDIDPNRGCDLMDRYHVYSSANMVEWVDEGEILNASQVPWGRTEGGFMWAPDCAYKNGTYYYYFPHPSGTDWGSTWKIGVATSTKPATDFTVQGYIKAIDPLIDPAVFVDDDGQAYIYIGGGGKCQGGKLKENMMEVDGTMQPMTGLTDFHEATWVHKRNGLYYLSYADNHSDGTGDNQMRYATSSSPLGPWTYRGIILGPTDSFCTHGSIVQFRDQWYVFYFNSAVSHQDWLRSVAVERLDYNADGTIQQVTQTTRGVQASGPVDDPAPALGTYEAEDALLTTASVSPDSAASGGKVVGNLHLANAQIQFDKVNGGVGGRATIHIHYSANEFAKVRLTVNDADFSFVNTPSTGGWSSYTGHSYLTVPLKAGSTNTVKLTGGAGGVNVDYVAVTGFQPN
jgi:hypothetical protein